MKKRAIYSLGVFCVMSGAALFVLYKAIIAEPPIRTYQISCMTAVLDYFMENSLLEEENSPIDSLAIIPFFKESNRKLTVTSSQEQPQSRKDIIIFNRDYQNHITDWIIIIKGNDSDSRKKGYLVLFKDFSTKRVKNIDELKDQTSELIFYTYERSR